MKKLTLLIACLSASLICYCQTNTNNDIIPPKPIEESKFSFGVKGAFGHSFLEPYSGSQFMPSWDAGISAIYSPFQHFGFGLDATYSAEGVKFEPSETTYQTNLNYIRVPLKAIYFFRSYERDFRPKIAVGPTFGFLTNSSDNPGYNTFDFGLNASLGFNYRLARAIWLNVDASYYQGLTDVYSGNDNHDLNGNVRLNLGLSFGF